MVLKKTLEIESNWVPGQPLWIGGVDAEMVAVQVEATLNGKKLSHKGCQTEVFVFTRREAELDELMPIKEPPDTSKMLLCPMPGLIVSLAVEEGSEVKVGEVLKIENILRAERDATVSKITCEPGDILAVDAVIMEFE